jgi:hypothetical protein
MKYCVYGSLYVLLILLTSCSPIGAEFDNGILTDQPCKVPCWNGLTPGSSKSSDVDRFVQGLSTTEWAGRRTRNYSAICKAIEIGDRPGNEVNAFVNFQIKNGKLIFIQSVHGNMPNLGQIVDHLGPPEYVAAINAIGPDGTFYSLDIYYPKQGIALNVKVYENDLGIITQRMAIDEIQYYEPGELLNYYLAKLECVIGRDKAVEQGKYEIANFIQPWPGFGPVGVIVTR